MIDLHLHSHFSDGTFTPEEIRDAAVRRGLKGLALTDHDTVEGCGRLAELGSAVGIEVLTGVELTSEWDSTEVHLLGYGIALDDEPLRAALEECQRVRQERVREMVNRLNGLGIRLKLEAVLALANCRSPGRPHVARALVAQGTCGGMDEAFERFLKRGRPAWVPKRKLLVGEGIRLVQEAGGVAVLAHPGISSVDGILADLVAAGLDGIECYHTKHGGTATQKYLRLAAEANLLVTGGSDCHGLNKGVPLIGTVKVPLEHFERLRQVIGRRHRNRLRPGNPRNVKSST